MKLAAPKRLRFLISEDFPPFSYRDASGALNGFSIAVARSLCAEARMHCSFVILPWEKLRPALEKKQGDVILAGPRMDSRAWETMDFTRPYLKAMGRFASRRPAPVESAGARALAGRRIGVLKNTIHARWLTRAYPRSRIHLYEEAARAREALRTARIDVLFGDWLRLAYWVSGRDSHGCCQLLPGWFPARDFAWNDLAMAVRRGEDGLRDLLDQKLDALQADGRLSAIAARFLPVGAGEP